MRLIASYISFFIVLELSLPFPVLLFPFRPPLAAVCPHSGLAFLAFFVRLLGGLAFLVFHSVISWSYRYPFLHYLSYIVQRPRLAALG